MPDANRPGVNGPSFNDRLLDLLVYLPAGIAVSVVEDFPELAERGRRKLGVRISSARAVGQFAVQMGNDELRRLSGSLLHRPGGGSPSDPSRSSSGTSGAGVAAPPTGGFPAAPAPSMAEPPEEAQSTSEGSASAGLDSATSDGTQNAPVTGSSRHVPPVASLSIPGFDTLSASQVVQRLDGLNRSELVSVRAYEVATRGRRTILSRVDQLLDERS